MKIWETTQQLTHLTQLVRKEYNQTNKITTPCPFCNKVPEILKNNEYELFISCSCGKLSFGERY